MTIILRAYKFRVYPTIAQRTRMAMWRASLRWLWNLALEQRRMGLARTRDERVYPSYFSQSKEMTPIVEIDARLADVPSCCRQQVLRDLELAYKRCFARLAREPHFKRRDQEAGIRLYASDVGAWSIDGQTLTFRKLGDMRVVADRPIDGTASSCSLVTDVDEHYAVVRVTRDIDVTPNAWLPAIGINRGAVNAIVDSTGRVAESPRILDRELAHVARLSRSLSRKESRSKNAEKARVKLAKKHQKIRRRREWWLHQQSLHYARTASVIGIESFDTKAMTSSASDERVTMPKKDLNRAILDVGWYAFEQQIRYKAEERGARVIRVAHTFISRTCSSCGTVHDKPRSGRAQFGCSSCGAAMLGDENAAKNILARALAAPAETPKQRRSIKIPGRRKATETADKLSVDACGGHPPSGPDEAGISVRTA